MTQVTLPTYYNKVKPEWTDYNGHMNVAYYLLICDVAVDDFMIDIKMDDEYRKRTGGSLFTLETHITYGMEVHEGDRVKTTLQILDSDTKRVHCVLQMYREGPENNGEDNGEGDELSATVEFMMMHVNLETRRAAPFPDDLMETISGLRDDHKAFEVPSSVGHQIGIRKK